MCILKRSLVLGFILGQIWRRIIVRWVLLIGYLELPSLSNKLQLSPSLDHAYCHRPSSMSMAIPYRHNRTRPHNLKLDSIQLMQPESLTPSPNLGESRESQLNADELPQNNTNMQDVDMQNVDEGMNDNYEYDDNNGNSNSDDNANGSDSHPPSPPSSSPPLPSSTSPPDSSELMLIQHQNNGWSTKNAAYKSKQMNA
ncbi:hypothetical protein SI65_04296 [Aspergillus cristatus]|uniref:Uncharacterized protein n=1 Tax=Aspergillus cristatus TaxID=573508 RepID=A0A1E3BJT1_ASPCR|nr:hypothetical protein SI65_04296 [Aspergillus cristatus]